MQISSTLSSKLIADLSSSPALPYLGGIAAVVALGYLTNFFMKATKYFLIGAVTVVAIGGTAYLIQKHPEEICKIAHQGSKFFTPYVESGEMIFNTYFA
jgi:hypothetical protein